jgi:glycosyltransferase involved in cell wall biosynthesis
MRAPVGGLFRHVRDLARAQAELGHHIGVVCDSVAGDRLTEDRLTALSPHLALGLYRFPMSREIGWQDRLSYLAIRDVVGGLLPDIVHGHGAKGGALGRLVAAHMKRRGYDLAAFYTPHGGSLNYAPDTLKGRAYGALERHLLGATDGLIFESAYASRAFVQSIDARTADRRIIHNGLHDEEFALASPFADAADFVFIGELSPIKGVDVLLNALRVVNGTRPASALIVGDGRLADQLQQQSSALGLSDKVAFAGAMPIRQALARGRCLVMPSRAESLPYVALETTAAGVPLIATKVGGIPEIVSNSGTPLVPPDDVDALAAALAAHLADPQAAANRALLLRSQVREHFTVDVMTRSVLDFYTAALHQRIAA